MQREFVDREETQSQRYCTEAACTEACTGRLVVPRVRAGRPSFYYFVHIILIGIIEHKDVKLITLRGKEGLGRKKERGQGRERKEVYK